MCSMGVLLIYYTFFIDMHFLYNISQSLLNHACESCLQSNIIFLLYACFISIHVCYLGWLCIQLLNHIFCSDCHIIQNIVQLILECLKNDQYQMKAYIVRKALDSTWVCMFIQHLPFTFIFIFLSFVNDILATMLFLLWLTKLLNHLIHETW